MIEFNEQHWGVFMNEKHYCKFDLEAPDWVKEGPGLSWYSEGVVIWDNSKKIVINLNFWHAMSLLDKLKNNSDWKKQGYNVSEEYHQFSVEISRKKRKQSKVAEDQPHSMHEKVTIQLNLSPEHVKELLNFLEQNESLIHSKGSLIEFQYEQAMKELAKMIYEDMTKEVKQDGSNTRVTLA